MESFVGKVVGNIIEARFAFSGKLVKVAKRTGDKVKRGEMLAALDRGQLQAELDRQLAEFEKTRAEWEIFNQKHSDPIIDEIDKYLKSGEQAQLNIAVKDVELAKMKMDQCDLISPIAGVILDDGGNVPGIYIAPSSFAFKIIALESLRLATELTQKQLSFFRSARQVKVVFDGIGEFDGTTQLPIPGQVTGKEEPKFCVLVSLPENEMLLPGMIAEVRLE